MRMKENQGAYARPRMRSVRYLEVSVARRCRAELSPPDLDMQLCARNESVHTHTYIRYDDDDDDACE